MNRRFLYPLLYLLLLLLLSGVVVFLWNALLPRIIHVGPINYWQALGLMVLCRVLFGGYNFGWKGWDDDRPKHLLKDKLMGMNEADREAFKEEWKRRCEGRKREDDNLG